MSWQNNLKQVETEKRRWAVLAHLDQSKPTRQLNSEILTMGCDACGLPTTEQQMADTLAWLEEGGYITTEHLGSMLVAKITRAGRDVAIRKVTKPGFVPFGLDG